MLAPQYGNTSMLGSSHAVSCAEAYSAVCKQVNTFWLDIFHLAFRNSFLRFCCQIGMAPVRRFLDFLIKNEKDNTGAGSECDLTNLNSPLVRFALYMHAYIYELLILILIYYFNIYYLSDINNDSVRAIHALTDIHIHTRRFIFPT